MTVSAAKVSNPSVREKVSQEEWQTRVELAALYRIVAKYGMTDLGGTHLSARVPGPEHHFLLNPFGLLFEEVTASNLVKVDMDGNIVGESDYPVNAAGFTIHSAVHMARPEIQCVAHTHTVAGIALSCLEEGLLPVTQHSMRFYKRVAYHDWEGIATNLDERERLVQDLGKEKAMILRNHGLLTCGESIPEAWRILYYLEKSCASQLEAMAAAHARGKELIIPSEEVCEYTGSMMEKRSPTDHGTRDWAGQLRLLDKEQPDYIN
jgi:ribulose-5-phosphate 4-epimerase/fuculose-1-phosphate aldolase